MRLTHDDADVGFTRRRIAVVIAIADGGKAFVRRVFGGNYDLIFAGRRWRAGYNPLRLGVQMSTITETGQHEARRRRQVLDTTFDRGDAVDDVERVLGL